jgi:homopolymeric O-antigen transport system permease protein
VATDSPSPIIDTRLTYLVHTHIEPPGRWAAPGLRDFWHYRELLFYLVWRDIQVRYKQTMLGVAWAVIQPFLTMVVFSVFFGALAGLPSDGLPYPLFTYTALLPWQLFAFGLAESSNSLVNNQRLISKIYFPRLVIPVSAALSGLVDFAIAFLVLLGMMLFYGEPLTLRILVLPLLIMLTIIAALSLGLWLAALNVKYRDVRYVIPFIIQLGFFLTPIAYSSSLVPPALRPLYALNPMVGVVEGFRWALLGSEAPAGILILVSAIVALLLLAGGLVYFRRMEDTFADLL